MAEHITWPEAFEQGTKLGKLLAAGDVEQSESGYKSLIQRVHDETKDPALRKLIDSQAAAGMRQVNTNDVEIAGSDSAEPFLINWHPELVVNKTFERLDAFCQSGKGCKTLGPITANEAAHERSETNTLITELNNYLDTALAPLERQAFVADFNRRRKTNDFQADLTPFLRVELKPRFLAND
jgi:hypothetical protein